MYYRIEASICALVFLAVIIARYLAMRQFPNRQNRIFFVCLIVGFLDIVLDVAGSVMLEYLFEIPEWIIYAENTLFYMMQTGLSVATLFYVLIVTNNYPGKRRYVPALLMLPALGLFIILLTNSITHVMFYVDSEQGYVHQPWFVLMYVVSVFYMLSSAITLVACRKRISRTQRRTMLAFLGIIVLAVIVQYFLPRYLLTGPAIAVALTMVYLILQKPEDMLDQLTGVFTRGGMLLFLRDCMQERRRYQLIHIKLNNMYRIDRLLGFASGNLVMQDIGRFLTQELGAKWVFRPSGTRFVVITNKLTEHDRMLSGIQKRFSSPWDINGHPMKLFITIGYMPDTSAISSTEEMLGLLESVVRDMPRGSVTLIDKAMLGNMNRASEVETALLDALQDDALTVYYQPIISVSEGRCIGAEALVRFPYKNGMISPNEFIPIAERNMSVVQLDELVTRRVCAFINKYDPASLGVRRLNVNLSAVEFVYEGLDSRINDIIVQYGVDPGLLVFEITETAATNEHCKLCNSMQRMCERGFRFALDDFGTGYANISRVMQLPFYSVKLDRELLVSRGESPQNDAIYRMSARMFAELGLTTVSEGVETKQQVQELAAMGIDLMQGYYFARPMPEADFIEYLKKQ